jgi:hypothetical protein
MLAELSNRLDKLADYEVAMVRCAQLLDWVLPHHWVLPHNDEFDQLLLDHVKWVERERRRGTLPAAKTIKRPVSKPKLGAKCKRKPPLRHDAHYRSGGLHK